MSNLHTQHSTCTQEPEVKSVMFHQLSQRSTPQVCFNIKIQEKIKYYFMFTFFKKYYFSDG